MDNKERLREGLACAERQMSLNSNPMLQKLIESFTG